VRRLLVLTAIDVEARALARQLGVRSVRRTARLQFRGRGIEIACVGIGVSQLEARAGVWPTPEIVVAAGACGALAPTLSAGDLVVPEAVITPDGSRHAVDALPGLPAGGTVLTIDRVLETADEKARLWVDTGALAVDMESAIIVRWARQRGARVAVVRGVADSATRGVPLDLAAAVSANGRIAKTRAARAMLARPAALGDALALRRDTNAALRAVAAALARVMESGSCTWPS
jgi:adenosylhomocysteine nucleosidase